MKINTREMILTGLFAALTAVGAFIKIPLGTVPITLQFLFTALAGVLLGSKLGALSQLIYVLIGLLGVPVFAGGSAGISYIANPTFGYLIGFIISAYVIGRIAESSKKPGFFMLLTASLIGMVMVYGMGIPYLYLILNFALGKNITFVTALKSGCLIFIPGDLVKCVIAAALGTKVARTVKNMYLRDTAF